MSLLVLDEQLDAKVIAAPLVRHFSIKRLIELRPGEKILDERVPEILLSLDHPTFITIDAGFWVQRLCHPRYAVLSFALRRDQQKLLPDLLRALFRLSAFHTRSARMGKVVRISSTRIDIWEFKKTECRRMVWSASSYGKRLKGRRTGL